MSSLKLVFLCKQQGINTNCEPGAYLAVTLSTNVSKSINDVRFIRPHPNPDIFNVLQVPIQIHEHRDLTSVVVSFQMYATLVDAVPERNSPRPIERQIDTLLVPLYSRNIYTASKPPLIVSGHDKFSIALDLDKSVLRTPDGIRYSLSSILRDNALLCVAAQKQHDESTKVVKSMVLECNIPLFKQGPQYKWVSKYIRGFNDSFIYLPEGMVPGWFYMMLCNKFAQYPPLEMFAHLARLTRFRLGLPHKSYEKHASDGGVPPLQSLTIEDQVEYLIETVSTYARICPYSSDIYDRCRNTKSKSVLLDDKTSQIVANASDSVKLDIDIYRGSHRHSALKKATGQGHERMREMKQDTKTKNKLTLASASVSIPNKSSSPSAEHAALTTIAGRQHWIENTDQFAMLGGGARPALQSDDCETLAALTTSMTRALTHLVNQNERKFQSSSLLTPLLIIKQYACVIACASILRGKTPVPLSSPFSHADQVGSTKLFDPLAPGNVHPQLECHVVPLFIPLVRIYMLLENGIKFDAWRKQHSKPIRGTESESVYASVQTAQEKRYKKTNGIACPYPNAVAESTEYSYALQNRNTAKTSRFTESDEAVEWIGRFDSEYEHSDVFNYKIPRKETLDHKSDLHLIDILCEETRISHGYPYLEFWNTREQTQGISFADFIINNHDGNDSPYALVPVGRKVGPEEMKHAERVTRSFRHVSWPPFSKDLGELDKYLDESTIYNDGDTAPSPREAESKTKARRYVTRLYVRSVDWNVYKASFLKYISKQPDIIVQEQSVPMFDECRQVILTIFRK